MTARVAVLGASGFVGRHVTDALRSRGAEVVAVRAPRLLTAARSVEELQAELASPGVVTVVESMRGELIGCAAVVNAAGVADATGGGDALYGADALLPGVVALAAPGESRVLHVSSAAVQGRRPVLDESEDAAPFSDYSEAKALGEQVVRGVRLDAVVYRPTSVQGPGRRITQQLARVAASRFACVAGQGERPTPQVLAENVADAIAFVTLTEEVPPPVVLHPGEGLTTASLLEMLGSHRPLHVPEPVARALLAVLFSMGGRSSRVAGMARRIELLWFGQEQEHGWLTGRWTAPVGMERWKGIV
ncbi:NAD(P)-dependent oxidoreductase [uncultured Nocardioides sp.]|uniref:NAD-dependent epimerase/dehydratase family protein n=1 Tax=uncultured Nocardioides sp. TaxID=198441 RepID=UPI0026188A0C|nr:NAD(P)-dependent oxidoreductase [uncultured Nocardioides sp.]